MEDANTTHTSSRSGFPSEKFLRKYFGEDKIVAGNPHRAEIDTALYTLLRDDFDFVLLTGPVHLLKLQNRSGEEFQSVYIFNVFKPTPWVLEELADRFIDINPDSEMSRELCAEFMVHVASKPPPQSWWRWQISLDSIWVAVIPEAIAAGKNKRRTLAKLLKRT